MKFINWLIETFSMPWFTMAESPRSKEYDKILLHIMRHQLLPNSISKIRLTATFGSLVIWLGNYPYGFGGDYNDKRVDSPLPTLRVAYRFNQYMSRIFLEENLKELDEKISNTTESK